jgi:hypothetical protein
VPELDVSSVPTGGRVLLAFGGVSAVVFSGMFFMCIGAFSGMVNPALPLDVRCGDILRRIFVQNCVPTLLSMAGMTCGMHMLVTAVMGRNRLLLNLGTAVVLTWLLVGLFVVLLLWSQLER